MVMTLLSMTPVLITSLLWSAAKEDRVLAAETGSAPKRTAVGPLRKESRESASSLDCSLRARRRRLFLVTRKAESVFSASARRMFCSATVRPAYSVMMMALDLARALVISAN